MANCTTIEWREELSVNEGRIDDQHKEIFRIINDFVFEKERDTKSVGLAEVLSKLTDYSLIHFREEERYMAERGFPGIKEHKRAHNYYIKKVALFNLNYSNLTPTDPEEVCEFLVKWWINHILEMDLDYKRFVENNN